MFADEQPIAQCSDDITNMELSCWRWGETDFHVLTFSERSQPHGSHEKRLDTLHPRTALLVRENLEFKASRLRKTGKKRDIAIEYVSR